jgi:hypothetical protein
MKANFLKKSALAGCITLSLSSVSMLAQAADGTFGLNFTTVPDVAIVETTGLDFGADLALAQSTTCTMVVDGTTGAPASTDARLAGGGVVAEGANYGSRTGDCDNAGTGTVGKYTITGADGVEVNITLNSILPGAGTFSFAPVGIVVDYDAATDGDAYAVLAPDVIQQADLATSADIGTGGSPIPGQTFLYVAGTLTAQEVLTAGLTYAAQQYVIDVVY